MPRTPPSAESLVAELTGQGKTVVAYQCDVKNKDACDAVVAKVVEAWGKLDILVNNAGIIRDTLLAMMTAEQWQEVIDTNLTSVYNFCNAVTRPMMSARKGTDHQHVQRGGGVRQ